MGNAAHRPPRILTKTIFMLTDAVGFPLGMDDYEDLRRALAAETGIELPELGWNSWFIYLEQDGSPSTIASVRPWRSQRELRSKSRHLLQLLFERDQ